MYNYEKMPGLRCSISEEEKESVAPGCRPRISLLISLVRLFALYNAI